MQLLLAGLPLLGLFAPHPGLGAGCPPCSRVSDCRTTVCCIDCGARDPEDDLRRAVARANHCASQRAFHRTIRFHTVGPCLIDLLQTARRATCRRDPPSAGRASICLSGHDITIDGENQVTFNYAGPVPCQDCSGACPGVQPGLFTLRGRSNTLENFSMQYFPSGINIRAGNDQTVRGVTDTGICAHAIDVESNLPPHTGPGAGRNIRIENNRFVGHMPPAPTHTCLDRDGRLSSCGLDKAIQVNGGVVEIVNNIIDRIGQPVEVIGGRATHTIANNQTAGDPSDQNVCQSYTVSGPAAQAVFRDNTIDFCKFGIRIVDGATAEADGNTITNSYVSAFQVKRGVQGGGLLKGAFNRVRHAGYFNVFQCQLGAVVDLDDAAARIDFGGGDFEGMAVVGGSVSPGGNVFCQGTLNTVWNITDGCTDGSGQGGSIGLRNNCVDRPPAVVQDAPPVTTATDGVATCPATACDF